MMRRTVVCTFARRKSYLHSPSISTAAAELLKLQRSSNRIYYNALDIMRINIFYVQGGTKRIKRLVAVVPRFSTTHKARNELSTFFNRQ